MPPLENEEYTGNIGNVNEIETKRFKFNIAGIGRDPKIFFEDHRKVRLRDEDSC